MRVNILLFIGLIRFVLAFGCNATCSTLEGNVLHSSHLKSSTCFSVALAGGVVLSTISSLPPFSHFSSPDHSRRVCCQWWTWGYKGCECPGCWAGGGSQQRCLPHPSGPGFSRKQLPWNILSLSSVGREIFPVTKEHLYMSNNSQRDVEDQLGSF